MSATNVALPDISKSVNTLYINNNANISGTLSFENISDSFVLYAVRKRVCDL